MGKPNGNSVLSSEFEYAACMVFVLMGNENASELIWCDVDSG
jgi:hypothetical protein